MKVNWLQWVFRKNLGIRKEWWGKGYYVFVKRDKSGRFKK